MTTRHRLYSCDDHLDVHAMPADAWTSRLPGKLQEQGPRQVEHEARSSCAAAATGVTGPTSRSPDVPVRHAREVGRMSGCELPRNASGQVLTHAGVQRQRSVALARVEAHGDYGIRDAARIPHPRVRYTWRDATYFRAFNRSFDLQDNYHTMDVKLVWGSPILREVSGAVAVRDPRTPPPRSPRCALGRVEPAVRVVTMPES